MGARVGTVVVVVAAIVGVAAVEVEDDAGELPEKHGEAHVEFVFVAASVVVTAAGPKEYPRCDTAVRGSEYGRLFPIG